MRGFEIATAAVLIVIAALAMYDSRAGAILPPGFTNVPSGFHPFWSAALIAVGGAVVIIQALRTRETRESAFQGRASVNALLKLVLPMVVAVTAMLWLGFYIVSALYLGFFSRYIGRYRWPMVILFAVVVPAVLFFIFERGFRVPLPKSRLYEQGLLPF